MGMACAEERLACEARRRYGVGQKKDGVSIAVSSSSLARL